MSVDTEQMWRPSEAERRGGILDELVKLSEQVQTCHRAAIDTGRRDLAIELRAFGSHVAQLIAVEARQQVGVTERAS